MRHTTQQETAKSDSGSASVDSTRAITRGDRPRITRREAREAILLQLRKTREDGVDQIYFGALNIHPDLDDDVTFGQLIDVLFDLQS